MQAPTRLGALTSEDDWLALHDLLEPVDDVPVLKNLLETYRDLGAKAFLLEQAYIDRDFSAAYSAFYAALFHPYLKYCRRLHFFADDLSALAEAETAEGVSRGIEDAGGSYLGFVVLRPVKHAPVGFAVASSACLAREPGVQVDLRSTYTVHVLGAELSVEGFPLTQQDTRVGACAQAVIWMAGRHFHQRHGGPWFSMPDINEVAIKPTDNVISRSLPAGSEFLTPDNMVRALRAMDRHPVVYAAQPVKKHLVWVRPAHEIVSRYLDSGIPVIIGLRARQGAVGHAVAAVGRVVSPGRATPKSPNATWAEMTTHFLIQDDQQGAYRRLPVREADRSDAYPWTLEDATYLIVPLPAKVFMTGEVAETFARDYVAMACARTQAYRDKAEADTDGGPLKPHAEIDPAFYGAKPEELIARTYLTYGWKYKRRALRNRLPRAFKAELLSKQFPRYVWVTELSLPGDLAGLDACHRKVRAHVVADATGSRFWDSVLVVQTPGLSMFWAFNPAVPGAAHRLIWRAMNEAEPFFPKVRGWSDFDVCDLLPPPDPGGSEAGADQA